MNMRDVQSIFDPQKPLIQSVQQLFALSSLEDDDNDSKDRRLHKRIKYRSVKLSDFHLATLSCLARDIVDLLEHINTEYLYLNGDSLDCWEMGGMDFLQILRQGRSQGAVVQKTLKLWRHGTKIVLLPGNHDEDLRKYIDKTLATDEFAVLFEATHDTKDGKRYLIIHGDSFDSIVRGHRALSILGTRVYERLANLSVEMDKWRVRHREADRFFKRLGLHEEWSLAHAVRSASDGATYGASFDAAALGYLFKKNADICNWNKAHPREKSIKPYDGIICGHTHIPVRKEKESPKNSAGEFLGPPTVTLLNTGCWVGRPGSEEANVGSKWRDKLEHPICTAIVEHLDGRLEHIQWVPGVGIVPLQPRADGSFENISVETARQRREQIVQSAVKQPTGPV